MQRIEDGAILTRGPLIEWVGPASELTHSMRESAQFKYDLEGAWITPGLIDCHTHLVFAGTRAEEYALRLSGVTYEEIARRGGGHPLDASQRLAPSAKTSCSSKACRACSRCSPKA